MRARGTLAPVEHSWWRWYLYAWGCVGFEAWRRLERELYERTGEHRDHYQHDAAERPQRAG